MANTCGICRHEKRAEIDLILASGRGSIRDVAGQYGLSKAAVHRHSQHLDQELKQALRDRRDQEMVETQSVWEARLERTWDEAVQGMERAKRDPRRWADGSRFLASAVQATKLGLTVEGKLIGGALANTVVNVDQVIVMPVAPARPVTVDVPLAIDVSSTPVEQG